MTQIQKIKPVNTTIKQDDAKQKEGKEDNKKTKINNSDIQNIKKFLIKEYEVNEKCLEIN